MDGLGSSVRGLVGLSTARVLHAGVAEMVDNAGFSLPVGTVTFLLTDIEGSSRAWENFPDAMAVAVTRHYEILDEAIARRGGVRPVEQGEGDSVLGAFARASDAVAAAVDAQRALADEGWPDGAELRVRMALHTGEAQLRDEGNYFGDPVNRCARLRALGHGGQVLLSQACYDLAADKLPDEAFMLDLGSHRLRDLSRPEHVWQLCHPRLQRAFPALQTIDALPNNLPTQLTTFVGRESEIDQVRSLLSDARLITLTGAGGCGKTRLALQVAADVVDRFADGVFWVELAPLADPALVPSTLAASVGVREVAHEPVIETLKRSLLQKDLLVVIDNCEHLVASCADLVDVLLRTCPGLRIVTTSREPLGVEDEVAWRTPSLQLPQVRDSVELQTVAQCEAVRLFVDRAIRARPNFKVTNENAPAVAQICHRLEGIPLAIELAAARTRVLTVEQIAEGLADRFHLLTGGARTALPRQRTLEASVDWSYNLLSESERVLFRRLSVFAGGFTLDAAEDVCESDGIERIEIFELLSQLVDRSLVQMDDEGAEARYRMLETIRHYARQKLTDAGEAETVRARHLAHFLAVAQRGDRELNSRQGSLVLDMLLSELDNLRAALDYGERADPASALELASCFWDFWSLQGLAQEGLTRLDGLLSVFDGERKAYVRGLGALAFLRQVAGQAVTAAVHVDEMWELAQELDPADLDRLVYLARGIKAMFFDDRMEEVLDLGLAFATRTDDNLLRALLPAMGAFHHFFHGRPDEALRSAQHSLELCREFGMDLWAGRSLDRVAEAHYARGDLAEVVGAAVEADRLHRLMHDTTYVGYGLWYVGDSAVRRGNLAEAKACLDELNEIARDGSSAWTFISATLLGAEIDAAEGRLAEAREALVVAADASRDAGGTLFEAWCLSRLGQVHEALGNPQAVRAACARQQERTAIGWHGRALTHLARARQARAEGEPVTARRLALDALELSGESGMKICAVDALEILVSVALATEAWLPGARLAGGAQAIRDLVGYVRHPLDRPRYDDDISRIRAELGDEFDDAWKEGGAMTMDEVVAYALKGTGERRRPSSGWESLTPSETSVVGLVAEGMTNKQVAEKLFLSPRTVQSHLRAVFVKVGVSTRAELASEATRRSL